jgi:hypothetical protein
MTRVFDAVDVGSQRIARYTEPFALLVAESPTTGKVARKSRTASSGPTSLLSDPMIDEEPNMKKLLAPGVACLFIGMTAMTLSGSHAEPYLALRLDLDAHTIAELVLKVYPRGVPPVQERSAMYITPTDVSIVNAATRLLECLAQPGDAELVAPLVVDEILIRLLRSPIGVRAAQMGFVESSVHRVAKAISWLRANFSQPMKVEELAELVNMSVSSFHEHFKSVTSMSPLHHQPPRLLQTQHLLIECCLQ